MKCKCCNNKVLQYNLFDCKYCNVKYCTKCLNPNFHKCSELEQYNLMKKNEHANMLLDLKSTITHNFEKM